MKRLLLTVACFGLSVLGGRSRVGAVPIVVEPEMRLDVTYTAGAVEDGPLSFGLGALPSEVHAMFLLGSPSIPPAPGDPTEYSLVDVAAAEVAFGDGLWTNLDTFSMLASAGNITSLSYSFSPINSGTATGGVILNFPLTITGTDTASGLDFEYQYSDSTQSLAAVPEPATVSLLAFGGLALLRRRRKR